MPNDLSFLWGGTPANTTEEDLTVALNPAPAPKTIFEGPAIPDQTAADIPAAIPTEAPAAGPSAVAESRPSAAVAGPVPGGGAVPVAAPEPAQSPQASGAVAPAPVPPNQVEAAAPPAPQVTASTPDMSFLWSGTSPAPAVNVQEGTAATDPAQIPGLVESLYSQMAPKFDLPEVEVAGDRNTMLGNIARGAAGRVTGIIGGLFGLADTFDTWLSLSGIPGSGRVQLWDEQGDFSPSYMDAEEFDKYLRDTKGQEGFGRQVANWFYNFGENALGYQPDRLTSDPIGDLSEGKIMTALGWAFETGAVSITDMVAAVSNPAVYWGSLIDEMAQERIAANDAVGPTAVDLAIATAGAGAQAYLEKLGAEGVLSAGWKEAFKKNALKTTLKELAKSGARAGAGEAATEGAQNIAQDVAQGIGTKKGIDWEGMPKRTAASMLAGAVFGGVAGGAMDLYRARSESIESGGDPNAKSDTSSASGNFGFTDGTWLDMMKGLGIDDGNKSREELLAMKNDPALQKRAFDLLTERNAQTLAGAEISPTFENLRMAHFLGAGDAIKVLKAAPDTPLESLLSEQVIEANKSLLAGKTAGDMVELVRAQLEGGPNVNDGRRALHREAGYAPPEEDVAVAAVEPPEETPKEGAAALPPDSVLSDNVSATLDEEAQQRVTEAVTKVREQQAAEDAARASQPNYVAQPAAPLLTTAAASGRAGDQAREVARRVADALKPASEILLRNRSAELQDLIDKQIEQLKTTAEAQRALDAAPDDKGLRKTLEESKAAYRDIVASIISIQDANAARAKQASSVVQAFQRIAAGDLSLKQAREQLGTLRNVQPALEAAGVAPATTEAFLNALAATKTSDLKAAPEPDLKGLSPEDAAAARAKALADRPLPDALKTTLDAIRSELDAALKAPERAGDVPLLIGTDVQGRHEAIIQAQEEYRKQLVEASRGIVEGAASVVSPLGEALTEAGVTATPRPRADTRNVRTPSQVEALIGNAATIKARQAALRDAQAAVRAIGTKRPKAKAAREAYDRRLDKANTALTIAEQRLAEAQAAQAQQYENEARAKKVETESRAKQADKGKPGYALTRAEVKELARNAVEGDLKERQAGQKAFDAAYDRAGPAARVMLKAARVEAEKTRKARESQPTAPSAKEQYRAELKRRARFRRQKYTRAQILAMKKGLKPGDEGFPEAQSALQGVAAEDLAVAMIPAQEAARRSPAAKIEAKIAETQAQLDAMPQRWRKKRAVIEAQIKSLQKELARAKAPSTATVDTSPETPIRRAVETSEHQIRGLEFDLRQVSRQAQAMGENITPEMQAKLAKAEDRLAAEKATLDHLKRQLPENQTEEDKLLSIGNLSKIAEARKNDPTNIPVPVPVPAFAGQEGTVLAVQKAAAKPKKMMAGMKRRARIYARNALNLLQAQHPGAYDEAIGHAQAAAQRLLRGQGRVPEALAINETRIDPVTGEKVKIKATVRGAIKKGGKVIMGPRGFVLQPLVMENGIVRQPRPIAREMYRDEGALEPLNNLLGHYGLLKTEPSLSKDSAFDRDLDKIAGGDVTKDGEPRLDDAAAEANRALVDILIERSREEFGTAPQPRETPPNKVEAKETKDVTPTEKPARKPRRVPRVRGTDGGEPDRAGGEPGRRPDASERQERPVQRAAADLLPERRPVVAAWLTKAGLNADQINDPQIEAADRIVAAYHSPDRKGRGFLLGDGTGFGKTREMLAAAAHLSATTGKPSVIIVPSDEIRDSRVYDDAKKLGLKVDARYNVIRGEGGIRIHVHVASNTGPTALPNWREDEANNKTDGLDFDNIGTIFVDEAQTFQNPSAGRQLYVQDVFSKADMLVYATATPGDQVPAMIGIFAALEKAKDPVEFASENWSLGLNVNDKGAKAWLQAPAPVVARKVLSYLRGLHEQGLAFTRKLMSIAERQEVVLPMTKEQKDAELKIQRAVRAKYTNEGQYKQQVVNAEKRYIQSIKAHHVLPLVLAELKAGRKVVIMASENVSELNIPGLPELATPMYQTIAADLQKAGVKFVTFIGEKGKRDKYAVGRFQDPASGVDVILTNAKAGGTGIDLDDQLGRANGDKPRTLILADLDWSVTTQEQIEGRVERGGTVTTAKIITVTMPEAGVEQRIVEKSRAKQELLTAGLGYMPEPTREFTIALEQQASPSNKPATSRRYGPSMDSASRSVSALDRAVEDAIAFDSLPNALDAIASLHDNPAIAKFAASLKRVLPDIPLRWMDDVDVADYPDTSKIPRGWHERWVVGDQVIQEIVIRPGAKDMAYVLLHEAAHAAGSNAIDSDPLLRKQLEHVLEFARRAAGPSLGYAGKNVDELWAESMSNEETRLLLDSIPMTRRKTVWGKIMEFVVASLRRFGIYVPVADSALKQIFELNILERDLSADERAFVAYMQEGYGAETTQRLINPLVQSIREEAKKIDLLQAARSKFLQIMTFEQIVEQGKQWFTDASGTNLLYTLQRAIERVHATIRHLQDGGSKIRENWVEWSNQHLKASDQLDKLFLMATLYDLDPSNPKSSPPGAKATSASSAEKRAVWPEMQKIWAEIGRATTNVRGKTVTGHDIYRQVKDYYAKTHDRAKETFIANYLKSAFDIAFLTPPPPKYVARDWHALIGTPGAKKEFEDAVDWLKTHGHKSGLETEMLKTMSQLLAVKKRQVYFPLRRHGDYAVRYNIEETFGSEKEAADFVAENPGARLAKGDVTTVVMQAFETFDTRRDADARAAELNAAHKGWNVQTELRRDLNLEGTRASNRMMENILNRMAKMFPDDGTPAAKQRLEMIQRGVQDVLIEMLPETAYMKAALRRKKGGVMGASLDAKRVFAERVQANSFYLAQLQHAQEVHAARSAVRLHANRVLVPSGSDKTDLQAGRGRLAAQQYVAELDSRLERDAKNELMPGWVSNLMNLGYVWYLVGPSFSIINATQPLLNTWPHLSSRVFNGKLVGGGRAAAAMQRAYRMVGGPVMNETIRNWGTLKTLGNITRDASFDPENFNVFRNIKAHVGKSSAVYAYMLQELADRGKIDQSAALDLRGAARNPSERADSGLVAKGASRWNYFVEWSRQMPHMVEVLNRSVTAIAAYQLALDSGMTHEAAVNEAANSVTLTQYNYEGWNKVPAMRNVYARPFLMFMQFPQHMYYYWIKSAREALVGATPAEVKAARSAMLYMLVSHAVAGGVIGAMFEPIKWAIGLIAWLFGDDDEPWDTEVEVRNMLADLAGPEAGEVLANGIPAMLGMNFQGRLGISDMLFFNPPDLSERGGIETLVYQRATGPVGQLAKNLVMAPGALDKAQTAGDYSKVIESIVPKFVKDGLRVMRYSSEGLVDSRGHTILDAREMSAWDLAQQAIGLAPAAVGRAWEARSAGYDYRQKISDGRAQLLNRFNKATPAERAQMRAQEIPAWNRAHPYPFARITPDTLSKSQKSYRDQERSFYKGVPTQDKERAFMEQTLRFTPD